MTTTSSAGAGGYLSVATPGFRFYPTEDELLGFYLRERLAGTTRPHVDRVIPVVHVYSHHPSHLRSMAGEESLRDAEQWFFFCPRAERETRGGRPARTTPSGYWKATGSPSFVFSSSSSSAAAGNGNKVIGVKRTMVFYQGRPPTGAKTAWKMNEYKAVVDATTGDHTTAPLRLRNEFSVCRVYISTGTVRSFDRRPLNPRGGNGHAAGRRHEPSAANTADVGVTSSIRQADDCHDWSTLITSTTDIDNFYPSSFICEPRQY